MAAAAARRLRDRSERRDMANKWWEVEESDRTARTNRLWAGP